MFSPSSTLTRRGILRHMGGLGFLATLGAGVSALVDTPTAGAEVSPDCGCLVYCNRDEYHCNNGNSCGRGRCCYHCTGCGQDYYSCEDYPCSIITFVKCA